MIPTTERPPTIDDVKRALVWLGEAVEGSLPSAAAASLLEHILTPIAGLRYADEVNDLCGFIQQRARGCDDFTMKVLAVGFGHDLWHDAISAKHPPVAAATLDLVRSVALYLVRTAIYWDTQGDTAKAAEGAAT